MDEGLRRGAIGAMPEQVDYNASEHTEATAST
ncbi:hypothetical protein PR003_g21374 [Phytophthora rubi]|uniref:Uncharacterized protein n=1 Tax=Phytophthora rubi TaxID=129364 RepID=A0A6A4DHB5_9STRA|nr:hypothetical protein PR003_g21374 [Phytophthora rubi]